MVRLTAATIAIIALGVRVPAVQQTGASRTALAMVSDARNRSIVDVGADDFVIQEAGQTREVLSVRVADYPVVVMLDNGTESRGDFPMQKKAAERFIERLGPRPIVVGTLSEPPQMLTTFEDDRHVMMERLAALELSAGSRSVLLQGASLGGRTIGSTGSLFGALVVLSATAIDSSSGLVDAMLAPIADSRAVLHVIAHRTAQPAGPAGQVFSEKLLRSIAEQTRGAYTIIYNPASYQAALDRLAERLTSEMMVEYLVPADSKPVDVKVGVKVPGARVRGLGVAPR